MAPVEVCQACQRCCRQLAIGLPLGDKMAELFNAHYERDVDKARFVIHHKCAHLTDDGLCDLWHEDEAQDRRPQICKEFMCEKAENPDLIVLDVSAIGE